MEQEKKLKACVDTDGACPATQTFGDISSGGGKRQILLGFLFAAVTAALSMLEKNMLQSALAALLSGSLFS